MMKKRKYILIFAAIMVLALTSCQKENFLTDDELFENTLKSDKEESNIEGEDVNFESESRGDDEVRPDLSDDFLISDDDDEEGDDTDEGDLINDDDEDYIEDDDSGEEDDDLINDDDEDYVEGSEGGNADGSRRNTSEEQIRKKSNSKK